MTNPKAKWSKAFPAPALTMGVAEERSDIGSQPWGCPCPEPLPPSSQPRVVPKTPQVMLWASAPPAATLPHSPWPSLVLLLQSSHWRWGKKEVCREGPAPHGGEQLKLLPPGHVRCFGFGFVCVSGFFFLLLLKCSFLQERFLSLEAAALLQDEVIAEL